MTLIVNIVGILILCVIGSWAANTYFKARIAKELMAHETPYILLTEDFTKTLLVLGDSTGVGVGANKAEDTVAGRLASYMQATYVENYAVSGAMTEELTLQISQAKLKKYDVILIQIGGNDILALHNAKRTAARLSNIFGTLPEAGTVILMSAGNAGGGKIFPPPIRPFHTWVNMDIHKEFARVAHGWDAVYVNLYDPFWKDAFLRDPDRYFARDGLHPSSYGYGLWFDKVRATLEVAGKKI
jgi:lysophospholipase L1-like esterase